jgi:RNA polymerase primary sigma factor
MRQLKITENITVRTGYIEKYMNDMRQCEVLTAADEVRIAELAAAGDAASREKLIKSAARFVVSVAKQYQHRSVELCDLIQVGNCGLIQAAERFDPSRGLKFISFAVWYIRMEILKYVNQDSRLIRLPGQSSSELNKCRAYIDRCYAESGIMLTFPEAASLLGFAVQRVDLANRSTAVTHIDKCSDESENTSLADILLFNNAVEYNNPSRVKETLLRYITEREVDIIIRTYGIGREFCQIDTDIARDLGISREYVYFIRNEALKKLKKKAKTNRKIRNALIDLA